MSVLEKVAYLKGLAEGLALDPESKESKLFTAVIDVLADIADEVDALGENALDLGEEIDALSEDLSDIEEIIFGDDDDDDDEDDEDCDCCDDEDCDCCGDGDLVYEVDCPACGEEIVIEEDALESGEVLCPKCGEKLELVFDEDDEEDE
ncbi:MAG: phage terminase large subunit family protein [Oscillospiraceae bacterium]|jgi:DNA-directed RNA polymerase subunit RPC12/RpoP|nr:phage terminase large subunit family protein [Oscillospiraceae bacterium]